jgi:energy-coupling factor transporter ATP-binding protein EcfA2
MSIDQARDHPGASPPLLPCRPVRAASTTVALRCSDPDLVRRFDALLDAMPDAGPDASAAVDARLMRSAAAGYELWVGDELVLSDEQPGPCEDELLRRLNRWALDDDTGRLHLHAGLVERDGVGVLLVGPTGCGKSTLTAHLVLAGWTYHGDEMAAVDLSEPWQAHSFPRPLSLKSGPSGLLPRLDSGASPGSNRGRLELAPGQLGPVRRVDQVRVAAVLLVSHGSDAASASPVEPAEAVERLLAECLDMRRAGIRGVAALVGLATTAHVHRLDTGPLHGVEDLIARLVAGPTVRAASPVRVPPGDGRGPGWSLACWPVAGRPPLSPSHRVRRARAAEGWVLGGGGLVYDTERGWLLRLDATGAEVWRRLDGQPTLGDIAAALSTAPAPDRVVADVVQFAVDLRNAGLVDVMAPAAED